MSKALKEIDRIRALIEWRCNRDEIRKVHEPLKADVADVRKALDAGIRTIGAYSERSVAG